MSDYSEQTAHKTDHNGMREFVESIEPGDQAFLIRASTTSEGFARLDWVTFGDVTPDSSELHLTRVKAQLY